MQTRRSSAACRRSIRSTRPEQADLSGAFEHRQGEGVDDSENRDDDAEEQQHVEKVEQRLYSGSLGGCELLPVLDRDDQVGPDQGGELTAKRSQVGSGDMDRTDNPLRNAPHTAAALAGEWEHGYGRTEAVFPAGVTPGTKYWPPVRRIEGAFGDRNLVCSCPPVSEYANG